MKAILLEKPGEFTLTELPDVTKNDLEEGDALVRICHVGLCGTDIHAYHGNQPFFDYPRILGHELGVEVEAVGAGVEHVQPGMRCSVEAYLCEPGDRAFERGKTNCTATTKCLGVHVDGGMREYMILPAEKLQKSDLPTKDLALVEPLCIGFHAVERAGLIGDEVVAVIGTGPIGLGVVQFALLKGVKVVALDISKERLETCRRFYPDVETVQVDPNEDIQTNWKKSGLDVPEVVWDCTGNKQSMEAAISLPANGGKAVMVGIFNGNLSFSGPDFHRRELSILATRNATAGDFEKVIHHLENGDVDTSLWITHECSAADFPNVITDWLAPDSGLLKGVISF